MNKRVMNTSDSPLESFTSPRFLNWNVYHLHVDDVDLDSDSVLFLLVMLASFCEAATAELLSN